MLVAFLVHDLCVTENLSDHSGVWGFCIFNVQLLVSWNVDSVNLSEELLNFVDRKVPVDWDDSSTSRFKELNVRSFNIRFLWVYLLNCQVLMTFQKFCISQFLKSFIFLNPFFAVSIFNFWEWLHQNTYDWGISLSSNMMTSTDHLRIMHGFMATLWIVFMSFTG